MTALGVSKTSDELKKMDFETGLIYFLLRAGILWAH